MRREKHWVSRCVEKQMANDLLIEILSEELPPKSLNDLSRAFKEGIIKGLEAKALTFDKVRAFHGPRRLALLVDSLSEKQPNQTIERQGPRIAQALDENGEPTKAALGFARSCGVAFEDLKRVKTDKGECLSFTVDKKGEETQTLLGPIVEDALSTLPIKKPMRWGGGDVSFVRPVHSVLMIYGSLIVKATILGLETSNTTRGHRFHHPEEIVIKKAKDYESTLEKAYVIASFEKRRDSIISQAQALADSVNAEMIASSELIAEITHINEWPKALLGRFDKRFLDIPPEVLITSMASHQKYIALKDKKDKLLPNFIFVSNIESQTPERVVSGNEKVLSARLSDAFFFYDKDKQTSLESKNDKLDSVVFQKQLGTLKDKVDRLETLAAYLTPKLSGDLTKVKRAVRLSRCDLMTEMVGEFPSLQGVMGQYYALHDKEDKEVALALYEQYLPQFSGDSLPETKTGTILALAERIDTLFGIFGINQKPTGVKDPFKCRRLALGVVRILLEEETPLDIHALLLESQKSFSCDLKNKEAVREVQDFILERLKVYFTSQGIRHDVVNAVINVTANDFSTIKKRIDALSQFVESDAVASLSQGFKRVRKLFERENIKDSSIKIDESLLKEAAEKTLYQALTDKKATVAPLLERFEYSEVLKALGTLKAPIDAFFDGVMVLAEDKKVRANRLALLSDLEHVFLQVADLSELQ